MKGKSCGFKQLVGRIAEKVTFGRRLAGSWGESCPGRRNERCKSPKVGPRPAPSGRADWSRGKREEGTGEGICLHSAVGSASVS